MPAITVAEYKLLPDEPDTPTSINYREYGGKYKYTLKYEVFTYYSHTDYPQCLSCGVTDIRILTLDHINRDGAADRKS